jgi:hypothetical protein
MGFVFFLSLHPHLQYFRTPCVDKVHDSSILVIGTQAQGCEIDIWERAGISPEYPLTAWSGIFILTWCFVVFDCSRLEHNERVCFEASKVILLQTMSKTVWTSACTDDLESPVTLVSHPKDLMIISFKFHLAVLIWYFRTSYSIRCIDISYNPSDRTFEKCSSARVPRKQPN